MKISPEGPYALDCEPQPHEDLQETVEVDTSVTDMTAFRTHRVQRKLAEQARFFHDTSDTDPWPDGA